MPNDSPDWSALTDVPPISLGQLVAPTPAVNSFVTVFPLPASCTGVVVLFTLATAVQRLTVQGANSNYNYVNFLVIRAGFDGPVYAPLQGNVEGSVGIITDNLSGNFVPGTVVGTVYALGASGYQVVQAPPFQPLQVISQPLPQGAAAKVGAFLNVAATATVLASGGNTLTVFGYRFDGEPNGATVPSAGHWTLQSTPSGILIAQGSLSVKTFVGTVSRAYQETLPAPVTLPTADDVQLVVTPTAGAQQYTGTVQGAAA